MEETSVAGPSPKKKFGVSYQIIAQDDIFHARKNFLIAGIALANSDLPTIAILIETTCVPCSVPASIRQPLTNS